MQETKEEPQNGNGSCGSNSPLQACACCAALAQLRMPWFDAAVQHAAPHYPYPSYDPYQAHNRRSHGQSHQQHPDFYPINDSDEADDSDQEKEESAQKAFFFKLPGITIGKPSKTKKQAGKQANSKEKKSSSQAKAKPIAAADASDSSDAEESATLNNPDGTWNEDSDSPSQDEIPKAKPGLKLNFGPAGLAVSLLGIFFPALLLWSSILSTPKRITLVLLHQPLEMSIEFLLVAAIPVINFLVWTAICKNRAHLSRWLVMALGSSIGSALVIAGISFAALFGNHEDLAEAIGTDFSGGFIWLGSLALLSAATSAYLVNRIRKSWELASSRMKVTVQAVTGALLALFAFGASEYHPWCIRLAQYNAVSKDEKTRSEGLAWLKQLNPEREMRMECSDSRAAGLPGLFLPIKAGAQQQLYFRLTGTPYSFRDEKSTDLASMSNDYLTRHVVGDKIPHLGLTRSSLNGTLHANTLSSTLNWTFVVRNGGSGDQELRAEIGLPAGAVVTGLTVWNKGEPQDASFVASGKMQNSGMINAGGDTPGMVTDLGHGRVLLHCYPVPREEELKVRLTMVMPLRSETSERASLMTPQIIASNFELDGEHSLRLRSTSKLTSVAKDVESGTIPGGDFIISGKLTSQQLETAPILIQAERPRIDTPYAVLDRIAVKHRFEDEKEKERIRRDKAREQERRRKEEAEADKQDIGQLVLMIDGSKGVKTQIENLSKVLAQKKGTAAKKASKTRILTINPQYLLENISQEAAPAPKHLVVVVDGSVSMEKYKDELYKALSKIPSSIPASVILAKNESSKNSKPMHLSEFLLKLGSLKFEGGQDNLQAVVRASELAGETRGAAVLWVHGPQPVNNQEIYIMSPYEAAPSFYELPVIAGTDTYEFFKNHSEIGPFNQVPRNGRSVEEDLSEFISKWNPKNNRFVAKLSQVEKLPANAVAPGKDEGQELLILKAAREAEKLVSSRHYRRAARLALAYGFVSPVSSAYLSSNQPEAGDADLNPGSLNDSDENEPESLTPSKVVLGNMSKDAFDVASQTGAAAAPILQGASNGTVGPQGSDATVIMGVNTAGTVRVNNLANLEALLNIIANLGEIGALLCGLCLVVHGFMKKSVLRLGEDVEIGPAGKITLGCILMVLGFALPGVINWFVASARDANLFS